MKLITIVGARPQFVKASVFSNAFKELNMGGVNKEILIHTGQHYDANMSKVFFDEMCMKEPDYNLGVKASTHGKMTGDMLGQIEQVLQDEKPDCVLVYGDTNSTLAGALAAAKLNIPIAHIEAGLRSFNKRMPEEINRIMTDHVSEVLFAPTKTACQNLLREGLDGDNIINCGDVMYDACLFFGDNSDRESSILKETKLKANDYILATIHRAENTDDRGKLTLIMDSLIEASQTFSVILPLHPRTRSLLQSYDLLAEVESKIQLIDPVGYLDMIQLMKNAKLIVTDSGGVQKEAFFFKVPCVTLRDETEWVELVELGWNTLVPPVVGNGSVTKELLNSADKVGINESPYGDGKASNAIALEIMKRFSS